MTASYANLEAALRNFQRAARVQAKGNAEIPCKKSKAKPYKLQNTFEKSLRGVPGGGFFGMATAEKTGTRVRKEPDVGLLKSARNSNTTAGNYYPTKLDGQTEIGRERKVSW